MIYVLLSAGMVLLDQWFKLWVVEHIAPGGSMALLPGVMELTYVRNYGAAFSLLPGRTGFFLAITMLFCLGAILVLVLKKLRSPLGNAALAMVLGGAVGNALDRAVNPGGYVVDMFRTTFIDFAVFNIADCFIVVGGILFCLYILLAERKAEPAPAAAEAAAPAQAPGPGPEAETETPPVPGAQAAQEEAAGEPADDDQNGGGGGGHAS